MTTSRSALILSVIALILLALVPAVSANEIVYDEDIVEYSDTSKSGTQYYKNFVRIGSGYLNHIGFKDITKAHTLHYLIFELNGDRGVWENGTKITDGRHDFTYTFNGKDRSGVLYITRKTNILGQVTSTQFTIFLNDWDIGDLTGEQSVQMPFYFYQGSVVHATLDTDTNAFLWGDGYPEMGIKITEVTAVTWKHHLTVEQDSISYYITINGKIDGKYYTSEVEFLKNGEVFTSFANAGKELYFIYPKQNIDLIKIISPYTSKVYSYPLESDIPGEPTPTLRTGTVTMTDHNGTTIRGFEVRAVNAYTGEEYTTTTETDVATITLPMDRTISLRNPQTGQYEDVPVGYYYLFGEKPGYKMTNEDGIRITVMPVEYSSYHFGDIIVTQESGYLTGKHLFQIRSRADNRILQTGTISAQSVTSGEWYNTTVVNGLATLILPYDTSDSISQYAGYYYVYATSPGYIDSDYATHIVVRPITQSEINTILLTPIGGIPEPGNVTLRIQVISDSGQGIPNAEILIDGIDGTGWEVWDTYTTSSSGYLEVSVYENSTYDIIVYATGYYDSGTRIEVLDIDPQLITFKLYPTAPTLTPTTQPTGWVTPPPTTQPPGIPDEDDDSEGFLMEAIRGISKAFGVGFATGKTIFGMLLALAIGFATAKHLRGGAAEFGLGLLGGTMLGVLIGLLPVWVVVVLLLIVGMYVGYRYVGGGNSG